MLVRGIAPGLKRPFAIERTPLHSSGNLAQARREAAATSKVRSEFAFWVATLIHEPWSSPSLDFPGGMLHRKVSRVRRLGHQFRVAQASK